MKTDIRKENEYFFREEYLAILEEIIAVTGSSESEFLDFIFLEVHLRSLLVCTVLSPCHHSIRLDAGSKSSF